MDRAAAVPFLIFLALLGMPTVVAFWVVVRRERRCTATANAEVATLRSQLERPERSSSDRERTWLHIVEAAPLLLWSVTAEGVAEYFSPHCSELTGRPRSELLGHGWLSSMHPDDRASSKRAWLEAIRLARPYEAEHRFRGSDGAYRWFSCKGTPVRDGEGKSIRWVGVSFDITERREPQLQARNSEQQLELLVRITQAALWEYTLRDGLVANSYLAHGQHLLAKNFDIFSSTDFSSTIAAGMPAEDQLAVTLAIQACVDGERPEFQVEYRLRHTDGAYRWRLARGFVLNKPDGTPRGFMGASVDITQLKRAEEETRRVKERLEHAVRGSQMSIWDFELQGDSIGPSPFEDYNVWESRGHRAKLPATDFTTAIKLVIAPEFQADITAAIDACIRGETEEFQADYRALGYTDEQEHWRLARGRVVRDADGMPLRFSGTSVDITELKRAQQAVHAVNDRLELALQGSAVSLWDIEIRDGVLQENRFDGHNLWWRRGDQEKRFAGDYRVEQTKSVHPADIGPLNAAITACVRSETGQYQHEYRAIGYDDGEVHWRLARGAVLRNAQGEPTRFVGTSVDITSTKRAEEEKRVATERLELATQLSKVYVWIFDLADGQIENARATFINVWESLGYDVPDGPVDFATSMARVILPEDQARVMSAVLACLSGETRAFEAEYRIRHNDGSVHWNLARGVASRDESGTPIRFLGTSVDITDVKRVLDESRKARERLELAVVGSKACTWDFEMEDGTIANSRATYANVWECLGYTLAEASAQFEGGLAALIHPEDQQGFASLVQSFLDGPTHQWDHEFRVRHRDGSNRWHMARGVAVRDERGRATRFIGTSVDITDRKRTEQALRESEERFRATFENAAVGMAITDSEGLFVECNERLGEFFGCSRERLIGRSFADFHAADDVSKAIERHRAIASGTAPHLSKDVQYRRVDGSLIWGNISVSVIRRDATGSAAQIMGILQDISERKSLEQNLQKTKDLLELGVRGSSVAIFDFDMPDGDIENCRQTMVNTWETLGYDPASAPQEFLPGAILAVHPGDLARVQNAIQSYLRGSTTQFEVEYRTVHRNGSVLWRLARGTAFRDPDGKPVRFIGSFVDITDIKKMEHALRDSEERFRATFENAGVGMLVTNLDAILVQCNDRLCEFFGRSRERMIGRSFREFTVPGELEADVEHRRRVIEGQVPSFARDQRYFRSDGAVVWGNITICVIQRDETGKPTHMMGILQDITQRKVLEGDLQRTKDRLELAVSSSNLSVFEFEMPDGTLENSEHILINFWEQLGYAPTEAPTDFASAVEFVLSPVDQQRVPREMRAYLAGENQRFELEHEVRHKDGSLQWRLARGMAVRDADGTPVRFIGSHVDITDKKRVEAKLRESERRWRSLAETLPQLVWTATADGLVDYFSAQATRYTGRPERELLALGWLEAIHPEDRAHTAKAWAESVAQQASHEVEHRILGADGRYRWFTTRAVAVQDSLGKSVKWFGTCTDIESGKMLEEELKRAKNRLESSMRGSNVSLFEFDMPDGNIAQSSFTFFNCWEMLGYDPASAPQGFAEAAQFLIHPEDQEWVLLHLTSYLTSAQPHFEVEHRILHKDGSLQWRLSRGTALRDESGTATFFSGSMVDITNIKRIEAELQRAREAAEAANRAKDEFLANVSHEIRTPMNAILGMTELALDAARTERQRQLLTTVKSATRNLLSIINDLLDFSKIASGKLALDQSDFSLRAALDETVFALAGRAHRKGLELICHVHPELPDTFFGDAGRLRQVIMNLVGNAIKFTAHGEVVISVMTAPNSRNEDETLLLLFTVRDTGIGIAREKQEAIFRAFEQGDASTTRKYGGTGLGLTISAQIATLMGGAVTVESEPGRGSTFNFTARLTRSLSPPPTNARLSLEVLKDLRVLIVDDNETNRRLTVQWLTNWRMRPTAVSDASATFEALIRAEEIDEPFALVLLDQRLPDGDGVTLAAEIRKRFGANSKRLILLSSDDSQTLDARAKDAGIAAHLLKPLQHSELLETIWAVMNAEVERERANFVAGPVSASQAGSLPALRILVAEDNEMNVALLQELLTQSRHSAQFASDGRTALNLVTTGNFELLLLDLHMPEMDGFAVARAIRERERTTLGHLPIIALTARSSPGDRERCLAAGMDDFLAKPIEEEALRAAIGRIVVAFPVPRTHDARLLDRRAILRACGGKSAILERLCEVLRRSLPDHIARVRRALDDSDLPRLGEAAHLLFGTLGAFSSTAGALALALEDSAAQGDSGSCGELVARLESSCAELLKVTRGLDLDNLSS